MAAPEIIVHLQLQRDSGQAGEVVAYGGLLPAILPAGALSRGPSVRVSVRNNYRGRITSELTRATFGHRSAWQFLFPKCGSEVDG